VGSDCRSRTRASCCSWRHRSCAPLLRSCTDRPAGRQRTRRRDLPLAERPERRCVSGWAGNGAVVKVDRERILGEAPAGRDRRLRLAVDLGASLFERSHQLARAVGRVAVVRQRQLVVLMLDSGGRARISRVLSLRLLVWRG